MCCLLLDSYENSMWCRRFFNIFGSSWPFIWEKNSHSFTFIQAKMPNESATIATTTPNVIKKTKRAHTTEEELHYCGKMCNCNQTPMTMQMTKCSKSTLNLVSTNENATNMIFKSTKLISSPSTDDEILFIFYRWVHNEISVISSVDGVATELYFDFHKHRIGLERDS